MVITFCPWCGNELPVSLRDRLFEEGELLMGTDDFSARIYRKSFRATPGGAIEGL
jgi:hypothetical protein